MIPDDTLTEVTTRPSMVPRITSTWPYCSIYIILTFYLSVRAVGMSCMDSDIGKVHNQVKSPWFLEINPNGRIPAITHNGFHVFETSAILAYLQAEFDKENKFGFSPVDNPKEYNEVLQWMFFAVCTA